MLWPKVVAWGENLINIIYTSSNRRLGKCVRHFKGEILCCGYWGR